MTYPGDNNNNTYAGELVNYSYLRQMLPDTVIGTTSYVFNTDYDAASRATMREMGVSSGASIIKNAYTYFDWTILNGQGRVQNIHSYKGTTNLQNLSYTYDENGNVKTIVNAQNSSQKQCFLYDSLDRLTRGTTQLSDPFCQATNVGNGQYDESYAYNSTTGNLSSKAGLNYTYGTNHKHAVATIGSDTYGYDANGIQTSRAVGGSNYTLTYDAENRLLGVSGAVAVPFVYDGDGNRVKGTVSGTTIAYIGNYFEWTGSTTTMRKFYYEGSTRVAMRSGSSTLKFLLGDHLGSTSITTDSGGVLGSETRYYPWGTTRYTSSSIPTILRASGQAMQFNGQRLISSV